MLTWDPLSRSALVDELLDGLIFEPHRAADPDAGKLPALRKRVYVPLGASQHLCDLLRTQEAEWGHFRRFHRDAFPLRRHVCRSSRRSSRTPSRISCKMVIRSGAA